MPAFSYWTIIGVLWAAALAVLLIAAKRAPMCKCGFPECRGGCL